MIAIDTNLLVYAHRSAVDEHRAARFAIERAADTVGGWGVPLPCIAELWMVATHPTATGGPSTPTQVRAFLQALQRYGGMVIMMPGIGFGERLAGLAESLGARGPRIFDLQIGLTAVEAGATELWTHDAAFVAPPGLRVRDPLLERAASDPAR